MPNNVHELFVGIDLGTTNSAVATVEIQNGRLMTPILKTERPTKMLSRNRMKSERATLLPSCVLYNENNNEEKGFEIIVGDFAKEIARNRPYMVATSIKSQMGESKANYPDWNDNYPDQTPETISSRILKQLKSGVELNFGEDVKNVVVTVPANFNTAQREATLRAIEIAGFNTKKKNGEHKDNILLSEPEAVVYDVINQVQNGQIATGIDFSEPKLVLVFDIGGGTLDITLHKICRNAEVPEVFDIKPIATNRYSIIAGDTFDRKIANSLYEQYLENIKNEDKELYMKALKSEDSNKRIMNAYAEELKVVISDRYKNFKSRAKTLPSDEEFDYGGEMPNGYSCEDYITLAEFEEIIAPLMGYKYQYDDYKNIAQISDEHNIIYPILNVLNKASQKLKTHDFKVDAVILNGGMSRLYLIEERLEAFFGFKPITSNDPDLSVAQGAAVYHYYTSQHPDIVKNVDIKENIQENTQGVLNTNKAIDTKSSFTNLTQTRPIQRIQSIASIQNEDLYIGLKAGSLHKLIEAGTELPFISEKLTFSIAPKQNKLLIPIKELTSLGSNNSKTIALGQLEFTNKNNQEIPVQIQFIIHKGGLMDIEAWVQDESCGTLKLILGQTENTYLKTGKRILPPTGTRLMVSNELSAFRQFISNIESQGKKGSANKKREAINKIKIIKNTIERCGNPDEFAEPLLGMLEKYFSSAMRVNAIPIARKLSRYWTEEQVKRLSKICLTGVHNELMGWSNFGLEVTANIEEIQTIGFCGIENDCIKLKKLCDPSRQNASKYRTALLYAFGISGFNNEWILEQFISDFKKQASLQVSLKALAMSVHKNGKSINDAELQEVAKIVYSLINSGRCESAILNIALATLGLMYIVCKEISVNSELSHCLNNIAQIYSPEILEKANKAQKTM